MEVFLTLRAREELENAMRWYENQRPDLGSQFLKRIDKSIIIIAENPRMYAQQYLNFRRCVIRQFPFSIYFTIETNRIVVHAVLDNRLDPEKRP